MVTTTVQTSVRSAGSATRPSVAFSSTSVLLSGVCLQKVVQHATVWGQDGHTLLGASPKCRPKACISHWLSSFGAIQHSGPAHNVGQYLLVSLKSAQGRPYVSYGRGYNFVDEYGEKPYGILKDLEQSAITNETLLWLCLFNGDCVSLHASTARQLRTARFWVLAAWIIGL